MVEAENFSSIQLEGSGEIPPGLIKQVAFLTRRLEERYYGIPQDIEWSYDGQSLWVLQARPISTMLPIWTRKIAAEVIPGVICPLTWSINRPLTCGVWGGLFALVLGERSLGLDFNETATLYYSRAYFNASLLGQVFLRMGLPPESLEFLTRGAKMTKPPLDTTLRNAPGLVKLVLRELFLGRDFKWDSRRWFIPGLSELSQELVDDLDAARLLSRVDYIIELLRRATYYSILAPLSVALRQGIFRVKDGEVDNSLTPEVAALRSLQELAQAASQLLPNCPPEQVFELLELSEPGQAILTGFEKFIQRYGYLSEVGTDIAVPNWKEEPEAIKQLFIQLMQGNETPTKSKSSQKKKKKKRFVQKRVDLKGKVTEIYSQLLAELRWCFLALEQQWLKSGLLRYPGDIFYLEFDEIRRVIQGSDSQLIYQIPELVQLRRGLLAEDAEISRIPVLVYGNTPPALVSTEPIFLAPDQVLQGIPASPGQAQGRVKVLRNLRDVLEIDQNTILVVPYTDSGWAALLVRAGGLIAESGGRLSHGAILAREYGIPAIMDVKSATWVLQDGQRVRMDGSRGIIEISNDLRPL